MTFIETITLIDLVGVLGSLVIGAAYLAVSRGWIDGRNPRYNLANLGGSCLILVSLYQRPNAGAILIEVIWLLIALQALASWFFRKKS